MLHQLDQVFRWPVGKSDGSWKCLCTSVPFAEQRLLLLRTKDAATVSVTVASHAALLPSRHWINVRPSGRFPSDLTSPCMRLFDGWNADACHGPPCHVVRAMVPLCPAWVPFAGQTVCAWFIDLGAARTLMCLPQGDAQTQANCDSRCFVVILIKIDIIFLFSQKCGIICFTLKNRYSLFFDCLHCSRVFSSLNWL
jgi:hypothetical protein